jgi:hypothetical protein
MVPETSIADSRHVISEVIECDEGKQFREALLTVETSP